MRNLLPTACVVISLCLLPANALADLKVVATTPHLASVAQAIGGDRVQVQSLSLPTQDPHFVDARPHLALALAQADLLLVVGLNLEVGWLPVLQTGSRNAAVQVGGEGYLDCSGVIAPLEVLGGKVDRSMGDVHPNGSPHYMLDPRRVLRVAQAVAQRMAQLDPEHAGHYRQGEQRFGSQLEAARKRWEAALAPLRGASVLAYHRSQAYLADWLQLKVQEHLEPRPGIPPNPRHIARVLQVAQAQSAKLLLQESYYPTHASTMVAQRSGAALVRLPAGPNVAGGEGYLDFMERLVAALRRHLP